MIGAFLVFMLRAGYRNERAKRMASRRLKVTRPKMAQGLRNNGAAPPRVTRRGILQ
jgi:hypothetical protein